MRKRLAPSLVVTVSAALGACNTTPTKSTVATADPVTGKPDTPPSATATTPSATATANATPRKRTPHDPPKNLKQTSWGGEADALNPTDPDHGTIYVSWDGDTCFVVMPFPEGTKLSSWQPPPTKTVDCPPSMDDAVWDACRGGLISKRKVGGVCVCTSDGNPPPPPVEVECPKPAPKK
jgi:hypothetical protein